jgi:hypothetical protein
MSLSAEQTAVIINALITAKATLRVIYRRTGLYDVALGVVNKALAALGVCADADGGDGGRH